METKQCTSCPQGSSYNKDNHTCIKNPKNTTTTYQTNLQSPNWILGNLTMQNITK